ncbi:MAG TPA: histidine kinase dimerization/phospho-acceptor domain-containing protein [Armatimonadota bacterium]|nr:histidine kinase dimerization/phospho-acceptor domain-containing protein [Armatimonadota bacterium]
MPRYRIFIKIYLWFWAATVVMMVTMNAVNRTSESDPLVVDMRHPHGWAFQLFGEAAADILEREGAPALDAFINRQKKNSGIDLFLFDNNGNPISGRAIPDRMESVVRLEKELGVDKVVLSRSTGITAQHFRSDEGKSYIIAGLVPHPPRGSLPGPFRGEPGSAPMRLLVLLVISGIGCYGLALYVTSPIIKLGAAARKLAAGNLAVRVRPEMGNRRDEISGLADDFDVMADRVESLLTAQRNLLRDISHELRSPLARLSVALELCRQRSDREMSKSLDRIGREADRLNELIGQILLLKRYESGIPQPDQRTTDLAKLIREVVEDADFEARGSNRKVKLTECDPCAIQGSEESLRRAVENVVRNAIIYTPESCAVEVSLAVRKTKGDSRVSITVRD